MSKDEIDQKNREYREQMDICDKKEDISGYQKAALGLVTLAQKTGNPNLIGLPNRVKNIYASGATVV